MSETPAAEHTPGPWTVEEEEIDGLPVWIIMAEEDCEYHEVAVFGREKCRGDQSEYNARLAAAAPDLLEAATAVLHAERQGWLCSDELNALEDAVLKARAKDTPA